MVAHGGGQARLTAAAGLLRRRPVGERLVKSFDPSSRCPGAIFGGGMALSLLRPIASPVLGQQDLLVSRPAAGPPRLAPSSRTEPVSRPAAGPSSSRAWQQDRARLALGAVGRIDGLVCPGI